MVSVEGVGVLIFDQGGALIDSNDAFLNMFGYSREEVTSRKLTWREMTPPEYMEISERQMAKLFATGRIGPYEKEYFCKGGARLWAVFAGAALGDGTIIEYCLDISDRKQAEQQVLVGERSLGIANEALLRANADLKHFSYAVSHDMQEPLRMVASFAQALAKDYQGKLDGKADQYIAYAVEGARRMEALLTDLREYWSVDEQKLDGLVSIDCNQILARAQQYLESQIKDSGASVTHDSLPTVVGEQYPLTLLFQNLISNGIKYRRPETVPQVHISAQRDGATWKFSVADHGLGIERQYWEAIFTPFRRLHGLEYPGTGLGLAMCQKIVERFHGRIWVESTPGQGSVFQFTLPVADQKS
jgi:PAS domain S-box-containing protein